MKNILKPLLLGMLTYCAAQSVLAEEVLLPIGAQGGELQSIDRPGRGTHRDTISQRFGDPISVNGPVGDPPITRLEYEDFYVFLEYEHTVHTVLKHRRQDEQ